MIKKRQVSSRKKDTSSQNPNGVWSAVTRMLEDPKFTAKVASSGRTALAKYDLHPTEVRLLSKAASEGLNRLFEGNPGPRGKALATYMGKLRSKVDKEARSSLNDATFRRYVDPLRLHAMHDTL